MLIWYGWRVWGLEVLEVQYLRCHFFRCFLYWKIIFQYQIFNVSDLFQLFDMVLKGHWRENDLAKLNTWWECFRNILDILRVRLSVLIAQIITIVNIESFEMYGTSSHKFVELLHYFDGRENYLNETNFSPWSGTASCNYLHIGYF